MATEFQRFRQIAQNEFGGTVEISINNLLEARAEEFLARIQKEFPELVFLDRDGFDDDGVGYWDLRLEVQTEGE